MRLIDRLEQRLGRFAIPSLVSVLAGFQAAVWILGKVQPAFIETLQLSPLEVEHGQVWRLLTWVFVPTQQSPVWMVVIVFLMFMISDGLDRAWGAFRVNLYLLGSIFLVAAGVMLFKSQGPVASSQYIYWTLFFAFSVFYPNQELLVFFILPLKIKYLALIGAGIVALDFIDAPPLRLSIFLSLATFFIAFGKPFLQGLRQKGRVTQRRARFESAKQPDAPTLHRCHACGKTELDDPKLDFRVGADGEDYCNVCRAIKR
jgi:hypothetical protein